MCRFDIHPRQVVVVVRVEGAAVGQVDVVLRQQGFVDGGAAPVARQGALSSQKGYHRWCFPKPESALYFLFAAVISGTLAP